MDVNEVYIFANGNIAVFDENNRQITKLQEKHIFQLLKEYFENNGYKLTEDARMTMFGSVWNKGIVYPSVK